MKRIKNTEEWKNGRENNNEIKEGLLKSLIDSEIEFKFRLCKNSRETTTVVKECKKNIKCKKERILNLAHKQWLLF